MTSPLRVHFPVDVVVPRIIEIGMLRLPNEACGVIIPDLDVPADQWVHELKNRSTDPTNSFKIDPSTVTQLLVNPDHWEDVLIWHTHPSGHVGPSKQDLQHRHPKLKYLVVSLPNGEAVKF